MAKKKNLTFKLSKGYQVRGAGNVLLFCVVKWYEMYEKLDVYNVPYHVIFMFLEFSRNRLAGDEPLPSDSSFSRLFLGFQRWNRLAARLAPPGYT